MTPNELLHREAAKWLEQAAKDLNAACASLDPTLEPLLREAEGLTDYASLFRYPDAPYEPDVDEALRAIEIADQSCVAVRTRIDRQTTGG